MRAAHLIHSEHVLGAARTPHHHFRQGDILVESTEQLPAVAQRVPSGPRIILAHGEATGHHHSIDATAAVAWKDASEEHFVEIHRATALEHQEHASIPLPPGRYRVVRQREYAPAGIRHVLD